MVQLIIITIIIMFSITIADIAVIGESNAETPKNGGIVLPIVNLMANSESGSPDSWPPHCSGPANKHVA